jgi:DNA-binding winged helix-turn-helix (wHTH) protein
MYTLLSERVRFGAFEFDLSTGELRSIEARDPNSKALLREQVFQVLRMLVEREGKIVTCEEIKSRLWGDDTVIDFDQRINATIKALRRALGDSADNPRYIETVARRGYRLMLTIEYLASAPGTARAEITVEAPRTRGRWRGALATGALLAAGALGVWRYEVYRHRISLSSTDTIVPADVDNRTSDPVLDGALNTALRLFRKALDDRSHPEPRVINTDLAAIYSSAIPNSKKEGALRRRCRHRPVQYLNNILEQDHRAIKRRVNAKQGFREFQGARRMIQDHEAVHMIRKGQLRWVVGDNLLRQIQFIDRFFDLAT